MTTTCPLCSSVLPLIYPNDSDNIRALRFSELSQDRCRDSNTRSSQTKCNEEPNRAHKIEQSKIEQRKQIEQGKIGQSKMERRDEINYMYAPKR